MNDEEGLFSTRDSLPEEIRKNTVAMGEIYLYLFCNFSLYYALGVLFSVFYAHVDFAVLPSLFRTPVY
jgi:hypothetical protein